MPVHLIFDLLAVIAALSMGLIVWHWRIKGTGPAQAVLGRAYLSITGLGLTLGSYLFGTLNLGLSGVPMVGRSVLGALVGAIVAVELYKRTMSIRGSTGGVFVPVFVTLVVVGRIGCALSGVEDQTYGLPSTLPWAVDMGDGILRHPVALYESLTMAAFLGVYLAALARRAPWALRHGFYAMTGFYALQRFLWEFLKPYSPLIGPLNSFHFLCLGLIVYSVVMFLKSRRHDA